jgi:protocatechuate 3,4-dioxygenase beta subunit
MSMYRDLFNRRNFLGFLSSTPVVFVAGCSSEGGARSSPAGGGSEVEEAVRNSRRGDAGADTATNPEDAAPLRSCHETSSDAEGPYFEEGAPIRTRIARLSEPGERLILSGTLAATSGCAPLSDHVIDVWQADQQGNYSSSRLRGKIVTAADGSYSFETIVPGRYAENGEFRPAHIHLKVTSPTGRELLTTQLYFEGDPYLGDEDFCTREGTCSSNDPGRVLHLEPTVIRGAAGSLAHFDMNVVA